MPKNFSCIPKFKSDIAVVFSYVAFLLAYQPELQSDFAVIQSHVPILFTDESELQVFVPFIAFGYLISRFKSDVTFVLADITVIFADQSELQSDFTKL